MDLGKIELLSPAGNIDCFYAAMAAGADAVYAGGPRFGARAYAGNFTEEEFIEAIGYAHLFDKKLYMTLNTLMKEDELAEFCDYFRPYYEAGLDGVIVQDIGLIRLLRREFPLLPVHASTQMALTGVYGAKYLKHMGAERIVPARELSLKEIKKIHDNVDIEIEVFIHGAMCYCYSGMCLMSSFLGGRSGNRGRCAGPCRQPYGKDGKYLLSMKDLCSIELLPEIIDAGACSLKIEGRMKSPEYVSGVTGIYRKYLDQYYEKGRDGFKVSKKDLETLVNLYSRSGLNTGYFKKHNGYDMVTIERGSYSTSKPKDFKIEKKQLGIKGEIKVHVGEPLELKAIYENFEVCLKGGLVEEAAKQAMGEEALRKQLYKTGNTDFYFEDFVYDIEGSAFVPVKQLNELRRQVLQILREEILSGYQRIM